MSGHFFIVSEWLAKAGKDQELWEILKRVMTQTRSEKGCLRAHATRQVIHPGSLGKSKFTIVLLQEYQNLEAFDAHCKADYVVGAFEKYVHNPSTAIVEDWTCRLFSDSDAS